MSGLADILGQHDSELSDYVLMKRFQMPTEGGSRAAIAVTAKASKIVLSFYTLMVSVTILQLWYLFVLAGIALAYRSKKLTRNHAVANVTIWNSQASPLSIVKAMFDYRSHIPKYASLWALAAFVAWAGALALSLLISRYLILGTAGPVKQTSIYFPTRPTEELSLNVARWHALKAPQYLRAIASLEPHLLAGGDKLASFTSKFDAVKMKSRHWRELDDTMYEANYSYTITGTDFGLQHLSNLAVDVEGSCRTEYSWYKGWDNEEKEDVYEIFGKNRTATRMTERPFASTYSGGACNGKARCHFAVVVNTLLRPSFTAQANDPWYLTEAGSNRTSVPFRVKRGRPPLSCWEDSYISYDGGEKKRIRKIRELNAIPRGLGEVFANTVTPPVVALLTQNLGPSSLKSALTSGSTLIDAGSATIDGDLERITLGAYVYTKNALAEMTQFDRQWEKDIPNLAYNYTANKYKEGVADFVIYGSNVAALDLSVLVLVPALALILFLTVTLLTENPFKPMPWAYVNALKAPVLYSSLDAGTFDDLSQGKWRRKSTAPHYAEKKELTLMRPKYEGGTYTWGTTTREEYVPYTSTQFNRTLANSVHRREINLSKYELDPLDGPRMAPNDPLESPRGSEPDLHDKRITS